ncbi:hypothetical protein, partial [Endozoicomonas sp. ONNA2]|uniref:hypothetical protein n=1 Tax=Endozoicomonas sp. ONNA2 TaxID=2828741 RepID=UPI002147E1D0
MITFIQFFDDEFSNAFGGSISDSFGGLGIIKYSNFSPSKRVKVPGSSRSDPLNPPLPVLTGVLRVDIKEFFLIVLLSILSLASANECRRTGFYVLRVLNWNHEAHGVTREQS